MSEELKPSPSRQQQQPLLKTKSWSPDTQREAVWLKRKRDYNRTQRGRCKSFTESDLDELRACFELGFGFDSPILDSKLSSAFPALEFYHAVNKQYSCGLSRSSSSITVGSDRDTPSSAAGSPSSFLFDHGIS